MTTTKTNRDLMYALFDELVGQERGKFMRQEFEQRILPMFPSKKADEIISEEEYQYGLQKIKEETPALAHFLLNSDLPELPPEFWSAPSA